MHYNAAQSSIRGGPQSIIGIGSLMRNSRTIDRESIEDKEQKKLQKRAQLKLLLLNKFKNKYIVLNRVKDPELVIQI